MMVRSDELPFDASGQRTAHKDSSRYSAGSMWLLLVVYLSSFVCRSEAFLLSPTTRKPYTRLGEMNTGDSGHQDASTSTPNQALPKKKLILLDRDGVINEDVGSPGVTDLNQLQLTPQAGSAIGNLRRAGLKVAIITNQSCVGKGLITRNELDQIMERLQSMLLEEDPDAKWDAVYICTTNYDVKDHRRKPSPGMIEEACQEFQVPAEQTIFVGDTQTDMHAAHRGGVPVRILVATGYGEGLMKDCNPMTLEEVLTSGKPQTVAMTGDDNTSSPLQGVLPLIFVPNLNTASDWILQHQLTRT